MFMFDLELDGLTDDLAAQVAAACQERGAWPVTFTPGRVEKRWYGIEKSYPSVTDIAAEDAQGSILAPTAVRDAEAIDLRPDAIPRLIATLRVIGEFFPSGFVFRATHSGSPIRIDLTPSLDGLVEIVDRGELNEFTRYRVSSS